MNNYKYAIFLGAGASAADGAPLQNKLFEEYFNLSISNSEKNRVKIKKELSKFFLEVFNINISNREINTLTFPTFEEAIGILDLLEAKNQSLKEITANNSRILRLNLIYLMTETLEHKLKNSNCYHKTLIQKISDIEIIEETVFISTNYDILCDNAIIPKYKIDYGIEFADSKIDNIIFPAQDSVKLLKIHGSLNWLYCPVCNSVKLTPEVKGVYNLITEKTLKHTKCQHCQTKFSPIIVPPTYFKDFSNPFLNQIWHKTENALKDIKHLIFCGYSFPDADMHIKYLIKRIQTNRLNNNKLKISVINNHKEKSCSIKKEEETRFKRFLGSDVNYTDYSFEDFAKNPEFIMNQY